MWITLLLILIVTSLAEENVTITSPVDGETYNGDWLSVEAIIENDNETADSVLYFLNDQSGIAIPRLNTDWYTYLQNDLHHGYSRSPAPQDSTILWKAPVTGYLHEFCSPVIVDGIVYFLSFEYESVFAMNAVNGELIWNYVGIGLPDDAVTVKNGKIYFCADSAWCLDAYTGECIWAYGDTIPYPYFSGTPVVEYGYAYFVNLYNNDHCKVFAFDENTGDEVWSSIFQYDMYSCLTAWNGMLFIPTHGGPLYAFDAFTGDLFWESTDVEGGFWDTSPTVSDSVIYIGGVDHKVHAIDALTGNMIWETDIGGRVESTPAFHDGMVFAGSSGGETCVCALDSENGDIL